MPTDARPNVGRSLAQVSAKMSVDYVGGVCQSSMSVGYVGWYVGRYLTDTRPTLDRHYRPTSRPTLGRYLGRVSTDTIGRHLGWLSGKISTDSWSSVGRNVRRVYRSRCRPSVDRHTDQVSTDSGDWRSTNLKSISTNARPNVGRYVAHVSVDISPKCRPRCRSSIGRVCGWSMLVEYRPRCRSISRLILHRHSTDSVVGYSVDTRLTLAWPILGRHSADTRLILDRHLTRHSADTRPAFRPTLSLHSTDSAGRYSTDISADTRPIVSDRSSTDPIGGHWVDISSNARLTSRPTLVGRYSTNTISLHLGRDVGRYLFWYSTDISAALWICSEPFPEPSKTLTDDLQSN